MQMRPSLAEIRNVQGFLHKLRDDSAGPGLWLNELCLGDSSSDTSAASVRRLSCLCQLFFFHFAFVCLYFWHFHQRCVYPMRPKMERSATHILSFNLFWSATWGGKWGTPSHTSGLERHSGKKLHYHCSRPCLLPQGNRRTCMNSCSLARRVGLRESSWTEL